VLHSGRHPVFVDSVGSAGILVNARQFQASETQQLLFFFADARAKVNTCAYHAKKNEVGSVSPLA